MIQVAFFDTKGYDRHSFMSANNTDRIEWHFHEFRLSTETATLAKEADAVCVFVNDKLDRDCLRTLCELKVKIVALRCAGFNNVDLAAAKECGMTVVRVPAYSPHAVAEHTVALLLTLNRKIHRAYNRVREHNFSLNGLVGFDLSGKTAGIVGTGKIGRITSQILRGFGMQVLAYDPFQNDDWAKQCGVRYCAMTELLAQSDVISLHSPLTAETRHMLSEQAFHTMKKGVFIINTSRGKLIDTRALIAALKTGHIGGVALDVYEEEEGLFFEDLSGEILLDDVLSRLLTFPNVLITSHQAFLTDEALQEISRVTIENLVNFAAGKPLVRGTVLT